MLIESSVVNVGKANAPTDGRLPSQHIVSHTGLNSLNFANRSSALPDEIFSSFYSDLVALSRCGANQ
jgi:hypothetical protein